MSHSVQASATFLKELLGTVSSSSVGEESTSLNKAGKLSHRLKQRRQPWQMSSTRRISSYKQKAIEKENHKEKA
jgi:hypothetical protein